MVKPRELERFIDFKELYENGYKFSINENSKPMDKFLAYQIIFQKVVNNITNDFFIIHQNNDSLNSILLTNKVTIFLDSTYAKYFAFDLNFNCKGKCKCLLTIEPE